MCSKHVLARGTKNPGNHEGEQFWLLTASALELSLHAPMGTIERLEVLSF